MIDHRFIFYNIVFGEFLFFLCACGVKGGPTPYVEAYPETLPSSPPISESKPDLTSIPDPILDFKNKKSLPKINKKKERGLP